MKALCRNPTDADVMAFTSELHEVWLGVLISEPDPLRVIARYILTRYELRDGKYEHGSLEQCVRELVVRLQKLENRMTELSQ